MAGATLTHMMVKSYLNLRLSGTSRSACEFQAARGQIESTADQESLCAGVRSHRAHERHGARTTPSPSFSLSSIYAGLKVFPTGG